MGERLLEVAWPSYSSPVAQRMSVLVLPFSLAASPPALFCSAFLQALMHPCPLLHKLCFPGRVEEVGAQRHATPSLWSWPWSQQLPCATVTSSLTQDVFFVSVSSIALACPWVVRAGAPLEMRFVTELQAPGLRWFWDTCMLRAGGAVLVHSLASAKSFVWLLVLPTVLVVSLSDLWAHF